MVSATPERAGGLDILPWVDGCITVTSSLDPAQLARLGVTGWPTWECGVSTFHWTCDDQESCLLPEGDVTVIPDGGEPCCQGW